MRTTITVDDDVAIELERIQHAEHKTFKAVVNETLRAGLARRRDTAVRATSGPYTSPISARGLLVDNVDDVSAVLDELDRPS